MIAMLTMAAGRRVQSAEGDSPDSRLLAHLLMMNSDPTSFTAPGLGGPMANRAVAPQMAAAEPEAGTPSGNYDGEKVSLNRPKFAFVDYGLAPEPGEITSGLAFGQDVAIINEDGKLYAIQNRLPPASASAIGGVLEGDGTIKDALSGTKWDLATGDVVGKWCPNVPVGAVLSLLTTPTQLRIFEAKKQGQNVQVKVNVNAKIQYEQKYWRGVLDAQGKTDGGYY